MTIAPAEANAILTLRMAGPADAIDVEESTIKASYVVPSYQARAGIVASDPAAAAAYYGRLVHAVFEILMKCPLQESTKHLPWPTTHPQRQSGLFGITLGIVGVTEEV